MTAKNPTHLEPKDIRQMRFMAAAAGVMGVAFFGIAAASYAMKVIPTGMELLYNAIVGGGALLSFVLAGFLLWFARKKEKEAAKAPLFTAQEQAEAPQRRGVTLLDTILALGLVGGVVIGLAVTFNTFQRAGFADEIIAAETSGARLQDFTDGVAALSDFNAEAAVIAGGSLACARSAFGTYGFWKVKKQENARALREMQVSEAREAEMIASCDRMLERI